MFSSVSSVRYVEGEEKYTPPLASPRDIESQIFALGEKEGLYAIEEHRSPETRERRDKELEGVEQSPTKPGAAVLLPDALIVSSWNTYNGHRPMNDDLASPIGALSPSMEKNVEKSMATKMEEKLNACGNRRTQSTLWARNNQLEEKESAIPHAAPKQSSSERQEQSKPPISGKAEGKRPIKTFLKRSGVGSSVIRSATISAAPPSAYSPRPTPPLSEKKVQIIPLEQKQSSTKRQKIEKLERLDTTKASPKVMEFDFPSPPFSATTNAATIGESVKDAEPPRTSKSPALPISRFSTYREPRPRRRSPSSSRGSSTPRARSLSRSTTTHSVRSSSRSRSRPRTHRIRKRPPPILTSVTESTMRNLPKVITTTASPKSTEAGGAESPVMVLHTPEPNSADFPPPLFSQPSVLSRESTHRQNTKHRLSSVTVASSNYSPTLPLAQVRRVPLYAGKAPRIGILAKHAHKPKQVPPKGKVTAKATSHGPVLSSVLRDLGSTERSSDGWPLPRIRPKTIYANEVENNLVIADGDDASACPPPDVPRRSSARQQDENVLELLHNPLGPPKSDPVPSIPSAVLAPKDRNVQTSNIRSSAPAPPPRRNRYSPLYDKALPGLPLAEAAKPERVEKTPATAPHGSNRPKTSPPPPTRPRSNGPAPSATVSPLTSMERCRVGSPPRAGKGKGRVWDMVREMEVSPLSAEFPAAVKMRPRGG